MTYQPLLTGQSKKKTFADWNLLKIQLDNGFCVLLILIAMDKQHKIHIKGQTTTKIKIVPVGAVFGAQAQQGSGSGPKVP